MRMSIFIPRFRQSLRAALVSQTHLLASKSLLVIEPPKRSLWPNIISASLFNVRGLLLCVRYTMSAKEHGASADFSLSLFGSPGRTVEWT